MYPILDIPESEKNKNIKLVMHNDKQYYNFL